MERSWVVGEIGDCPGNRCGPATPESVIRDREEWMGINHMVKGTALAAAVLLLGVAAAACGGNGNGPSSLVPQRATLVGSVEIDQLLSAIDLDLERVLQTLSSGSPGGFEGIHDFFFAADPLVNGDLFRDVSRADFFGEVSADGDTEYVGELLFGTFDEAALFAEISSVSGHDLVQEVYKGSNVYSLADHLGEIEMSLLDTETFAVGSGGALEDIIDIWVGDADPASGPLIDAFNDLGDGAFGIALKVPQGIAEGADSGSLPQLGGLPISLDFISELDILGLGGALTNDSLDLVINMDFTSQDAAESLEGFISGIVSLASGFLPDPRIGELLSGLEIGRDGRRLTIKAGIPTADLSDLLGGLTSLTGTAQSAVRPPGTPEIRLLESAIGDEISIMPSANHAAEGQRVAYGTTPPTSGDHWARWADCGWYPDGLPDEVITHNLEHGNIVVSYNFTNPAQVTRLRRVLDGVTQFEKWGVARSYDRIPDGQIALSAWGRLDTFQGVAQREIELFFEAFAGFMGPERIPC